MTTHISSKSATMSNKSVVSKVTYQKLFGITLAAAVLTLSACGKKEDPALQGEPAVDGQTQIEQEATGVDDVAQVTDDVNSADITNDPLVNDSAIAEANDSMVSADEIGVATADDSEVMDGSESEEHVSTY